MSENNVNKRPGRPRKSAEEILKSLDNHREKARERYNENPNRAKETTKQYQKKLRDVYFLIKDLIKNEQLDQKIQDEELKAKIRELCS
jgi:gas vesicle protein